MVGFAPFLAIGYFTIFNYIICQNQLSPCRRKMQLFALYLNNYIATTKTKIRLDTNNLNLV